jgi:septal ring factor EnvC (AmiA/AmiB activator)
MQGVSEAQQIVFLEKKLEEQLEIIETLQKTLKEKDRELGAYKNALSPSSETKAAYIGEIEWTRSNINDDGEEELEILSLPWTEMKEFMALIRGYAKSTMNKKG